VPVTDLAELAALGAHSRLLISGDTALTEGLDVYSSQYFAPGTELPGYVPVAAATHAAYYSSTAGKKERQVWLGCDITSKANFINFLHATNTEHCCVFGQGPKMPSATSGSLSWYGAWAMAAIGAGMRAGSIMGEPLTWKLPRIQGITEPFTVSEDAPDIVSAGGMVVQYESGSGYKILRGITTYTKQENAGFSEESIVQVWKNVAYNLRWNLERKYTGVGARPATLSEYLGDVFKILDEFVKQEALVPSYNDQTGVMDPPYHDITLVLENVDQLLLSVVVHIVSGINYQLQTLVPKPANFVL